MKKFLGVLTATVLTLGAFAVVGGPSQAKPNASPHFLPTSFNVYYDEASGVATVGYDAAGLGNGGNVWIRVNGKATFKAWCLKPNSTTQYFTNSQDHQVAINEHVATGNSMGQYRGFDALRPNAVCNKSGTFVSWIEPVVWTDIQAHMYDYSNRTFEYDSWYGTAPVGGGSGAVS